jgi:hypothetical protein
MNITRSDHTSMEKDFRTLCKLLKEELDKAEAINGPFNSAHEAYAVLLEEVDELWDEVKKKKVSRVPGDMQAECIQIAASAIRFIMDVC